MCTSAQVGAHWLCKKTEGAQARPGQSGGVLPGWLSQTCEPKAGRRWAHRPVSERSLSAGAGHGRQKGKKHWQEDKISSGSPHFVLRHLVFTADEELLNISIMNEWEAVYYRKKTLTTCDKWWSRQEGQYVIFMTQMSSEEDTTVGHLERKGWLLKISRSSLNPLAD